MLHKYDHLTSKEVCQKSTMCMEEEGNGVFVLKYHLPSGAGLSTQ